MPVTFPPVSKVMEESVDAESDGHCPFPFPRIHFIHRFAAKEAQTGRTMSCCSLRNPFVLQEYSCKASCVSSLANEEGRRRSFNERAGPRDKNAANVEMVCVNRNPKRVRGHWTGHGQTAEGKHSTGGTMCHGRSRNQTNPTLIPSH